MSKPKEYLCQIDSGVVPTVDTAWNVVDSNLVSWNPEINPTTHIVSVINGGAALNTPYILGVTGLRWTWSVTTAGVLSVVSSSTPITSSDLISGLTESATVTWMFIVGLDGQLRITNENPLVNKYYYPAITISFTTSSVTDKLELHDIKPNTTRHRR